MGRQFEFGPFVFESETGELRKGSHRLKIHGQATQILGILLTRPGELIGREEFYRQLWPENTFLDVDHSLNSAVNRLRTYLCDSADRPQYIETLPGRGYRFIAPVNGARSAGDSPLVTESSDLQPDLASLTPNSPVTRVPHGKAARVETLRRYAPISLGLALATLVLALALARSFRPSVPSITPTVAVLPFSNLAGGSDDYFSDGLTEEIQDALSGVTGLRVVASTSAGPLKKQGMDIRDLGRQLNVSSVLEGSVRREGQNVRVNARLVGTTDRAQIWSHTYSGETASIFRVQQEIARGIADALRVRLSQANLTRLQSIGTRDEEAHDLYLSGAWLLERARSPEQQREAVNYLERAASKDPNYAAPLAVLSRYHHRHLVFDPLSQSKARALATRAVSLSNDSAEAHLALANALASNWEWPRAEQEYQRAIALQPSYWQARADFADYLTLQGRFGEARQLIDEAEGLSPVDVDTQCVKGNIAYFEQRWHVALPYFRRRHEIDPDYNINSQWLAKTLFRTGHTAESIALLKSQLKVPREDARYR
jgi:TolB-like protein/DNA-binding winged helix-turn-helix (wHTH) protein